MNSPTEPASPATSVSSGSPPLDDLPLNFNDESTSVSIAPSAAPNTFKRRLPGGGAFGSGFSTRDAKSRRREDMGLGGRRGGWEARESRSQKDELVDGYLVDELRAQFGDPFDDSTVKRAS
ncbi:hypothetical protein B0H21DRAFT_819793 [Amylocystis lapponica]|nr:hypothetical protein B0H21DRAFT_819793 [Amylocystis lapponica]